MRTAPLVRLWRWRCRVAHVNGCGLSHERPRATHVTCAVVIHVRCLTVIFLLYIVGLSQKNRFVRDQNDDMSEEGYYYPFFWLAFINKNIIISLHFTTFCRITWFLQMEVNMRYFACSFSTGNYLVISWSFKWKNRMTARVLSYAFCPCVSDANWSEGALHILINFFISVSNKTIIRSSLSVFSKHSFGVRIGVEEVNWSPQSLRCQFSKSFHLKLIEITLNQNWPIMGCLLWWNCSEKLGAIPHDKIFHHW